MKDCKSAIAAIVPTTFAWSTTNSGRKTSSFKFRDQTAAIFPPKLQVVLLRSCFICLLASVSLGVMNCNLRGLQLAERTQTTLKELHSFNVGIFEMRSKPERVPDAYRPGSPTYCARIHNSSEEGRKLTKCKEATDTCVRPPSVCACEEQLWTFW